MRCSYKFVAYVNVDMSEGFNFKFIVYIFSH